MPKRHAASSASPQNNKVSRTTASPSLSDEESEVAATIVSAQKEQQKKRRSRTRQPGTRTRTSIWTTIAAQNIAEGSTKLQCSVCDSVLSTNASVTSSNIKLHYSAVHKETFKELMQLKENNAADELIKKTVRDARMKQRAAVATKPIHSFFRPRSAAALSCVPRVAPFDCHSVPAKTLQAVAFVLYSCVTDGPFKRTATPIMQGFIDIFGGRSQYSTHEVIESHLHLVFNAVCECLRKECESALVGNLTLDGWSAALGAPILGITWNFVDDTWRLKCIPICMLNTATASKSAEQLRSIVTEVLKNSPVVGSDKVRVHTATSDNEPAVGLACDLLTNFVGSVRCVVHTMALCVNDVFTESSPWQKYMNHINKVTSFFNYHTKANILFLQKQKRSGVTNDRFHYLRHDIPTRWHSRLGAMVIYLTDIDHIEAVREEMKIESTSLPTLNIEEQNTLAEFIKVLREFRRVARQLEADRNVTMSRSPRLLRELYETLLIMGGEMDHNTTHYSGDQVANINVESAHIGEDDDRVSFPCLRSKAEHCAAREKSRSDRLHKRAAKELALQLAKSVADRLGALWRPVVSAAIHWTPEDNESPPRSHHLPRRVLLFHLSALMDINECEFEWLELNEGEKEVYLQSLYGALIREAIELGDSGPFSSARLQSLFELFHEKMRADLREAGRREPNYALTFWKEMNAKVSYTSPLSFNKVARALLSSQASSASAERLFSNLGRTEGRERQSMLSSTLEMTQMIRSFALMRMEDICGPQNGLLSPQAAAFKRMVQEIALQVHEARLSS